MLAHVEDFRKERFKLIPWGLMPIFFLFFIEVPLGVSFLIGYFFFYLALFYFRLTDDLACLELDLAAHKVRDFSENKNYLATDRLWILFFACLPLYAFTLSALSIIWFLLFVIVSEGLYKTIKSPLIEYISLLKYPVLLSLLAQKRTLSESLWFSLFFLIFVITEFIEKKYSNSKAQIIQYISLIILLAAKIIWSFYEHP